MEEGDHRQSQFKRSSPHEANAESTRQKSRLRFVAC